MSEPPYVDEWSWPTPRGALGAAAVLLTLAGSIGPWWNFVLAQRSGLSYGDGWVTLATAVLAAVLMLVDRWVWLVAVCGTVGLLVAIVDLSLNSGRALTSPGWGLIVTLIGSAGLLAWGVRAGFPKSL